MPPTVAVAHYPEGAGHATRMLAVADAIADAGATVRMAGGGAGTEFVALNGYDEFEPTNVDFIDTYQGGSTWRVASQSLPASLARIADYRAWLRETDPDALVTDDMFAAMAASRCDVPLYVLKHDMPGLYRDRIERTGARFHTSFQLSATREFFYPVVWPESGVDPAGATRIPPVALAGDAEGGEDRESADVVVVPSHYSELDRIATQLRRQGHDVINVADDDWDPVPSLLPYIRDADAVVCSGYSTIMDAAVAGTPCVVHPATDEQDAVADWLERFDVDGFAVAEEPLDVLDAVADPPDAPSFDNGAGYIAETVLNDLRDPDPYAAPEPDEPGDPSAAADVSTASRLGTVAAVPTLCAVVLSTAGGAASPLRALAGVAAAGRRASAAGRRAGVAALGAGRRVAEAAAGGTRRAGGTVATGARRVGGSTASGVRAAVSRAADAAGAAAGAVGAAGRAFGRRCRDLGRLAPSRP